MNIVAALAMFSTTARLALASPEPPPVYDPTPYAQDATPNDFTASWHADLVVRGDGDVVTFGGSKTGGRYCLQERSATTGALINAIEIGNPTGNTSINDHFNMPMVRRASDGVLWAMTASHGNGTSGTGNREYTFYYSPSGRIAHLQPASGGNAGAERPNVLQFPSTTHNYGQTFVTSAGDFGALVINDGNPQTARFILTTDPAIVPRLCRPVLGVDGHPAGTPQFYCNAVNDPLRPDLLFVVAFAHPSVLGSAIKMARIDLATRRVVIGGSELAGDIFAASGSTIATWGTMPTIHQPDATTGMRVHSVMGSGTYAARAVAVTTWASGAGPNARSHAILWCAAGADQENSANWQLLTIGAANRAQTWDNGGNRAYNSDIQFLAGRDGWPMRVLLIARDPTSGLFREEIWGIDPTASAPNDRQMLGASAWDDLPRPIRALVNPGAATDNLQALVVTFDSYPNTFTDFTAGAPKITLYNTPEVISAGTITGAGSVGQERVVSAPVLAGFPTPTPDYRWLRDDDGTDEGASVIPGSNVELLTCTAEDGGKFNARDVRAVIGSTVSAWARSNWAGPVGTGFNPGDLGPFIEFTLAGITSGGTPPRASAWASTTAGGSLSGSLAQATSGEQPEVVSSPFNGLKFTAARGDDLAGTNSTAGDLAGIVGGKSAVCSIVPFVIEANPAASAMLFGFSRSGSGGANQARWSINLTTAGALTGTTRRDDGDGAATTAAYTPAKNTALWAMLVANYSTGTPTLRLRIYSFDGATLLSETSATPTNAAGTSSAGNSLAITCGRTIAGTPTTAPCITRMPNTYTRTSGAFSEQNLADLLARNIALLAGGN